MSKIAIIDTGVGNLNSIKNACKVAGGNCIITNNYTELEQAKAYIMPGIGTFGGVMKRLNLLNVKELLHEQIIKKKKKYLGICLGMHLLVKNSNESPGIEGLNWIDGCVKKMKGSNILLPHVGWNEISVISGSSLLKNGNNKTFYFDHSYHLECNEEIILAKFTYENELVAAIEIDNIFGTQFHPEKSSFEGVNVIKRFIELVGV